MTSTLAGAAREQGIGTGKPEESAGNLQERIREALARYREFSAHASDRHSAARLPESVSFVQDRAVDIVALLPARGA
jgi:hypothetical protein